MAHLVESDWMAIDFSVWDAIQSYLVDHPDHYYMAPNNQWLCYLTRKRGLIMFEHDFTNFSDEEISAFIIGALELMGDD